MLCNMLITIIFYAFLSKSYGELISCNNNTHKGNFLCKIDENYDKGRTPRPLPVSLDSKVRIYDISDIDEVEHTITMYLRLYVNWPDTRLSYINESM